MQRDEPTLLDIIRAARAVQTFIQDLHKESFLKDYKTQSAVLCQIVVIGEAVKCLLREFRDHHPQIPWSLIAGTCDILIHGCAGRVSSPAIQLSLSITFWRYL